MAMAAMRPSTMKLAARLWVRRCGGGRFRSLRTGEPRRGGGGRLALMGGRISLNQAGKEGGRTEENGEHDRKAEECPLDAAPRPVDAGLIAGKRAGKATPLRLQQDADDEHNP